MSTEATTVHTDTTAGDDRARAVVKVDDSLWRQFKAEAELEGRNPSELAGDAFRLYLRTKKEA